MSRNKHATFASYCNVYVSCMFVSIVSSSLKIKIVIICSFISGSHFSFTIDGVEKSLVDLNILRQLFEPFGQLMELQYDGKRGAMGKYSTPDAVQLAIVDMNGVQLGSSAIQVCCFVACSIWINTLVKVPV